MRSKSEGRLLGQGLWSNLFYYLHINYAIAVLSSHSAWLIVFVFQKVGWNVRGVKCPWGEMSEGWNVFGVKCLWGEMYRGEMSWGEMSSGWNVLTPSSSGFACEVMKFLKLFQNCETSVQNNTSGASNFGKKTAKLDDRSLFCYKNIWLEIKARDTALKKFFEIFLLSKKLILIEEWPSFVFLLKISIFACKITPNFYLVRRNRLRFQISFLCL